ncbi:hypothetical protein LR48_Vigan09g242000 [Vigna angularis]|uniref:Auxin-repressed protein n=1 Tax=Phaseolus angularis TaxID=3914 RepID=A0A0L9VFC5_PHAAN|nr:hypothetical protein LR48_Vigan09g242000 [Vigna angularis]
MVLLEKLWDDVVAGPQPDRGLGKLRKLTTLKTDEGESSKLQKSLSMPTSPTTPLTPSTPTTPGSGRKSDNVWRSVFHPGSNSATKTIGAQMFDKPLPNTPTVYDWYIYIYKYTYILSFFLLYNKVCTPDLVFLYLVIVSTFSLSYQPCMHSNIYCI